MPKGRKKKSKIQKRKSIYEASWIKHINGEVEYEHNQDSEHANSGQTDESEEFKSKESNEEEETKFEVLSDSTDSEMFNESDSDEEEEKGQPIQDFNCSNIIDEPEKITVLPAGAVGVNPKSDPLVFTYEAPPNMSQKMAPKQPVSRPGVVSVKRFRKKISTTAYMSMYLKTPKDVSLEEAITDLKKILKHTNQLDMVEGYYNSYKSSPERVLTLIWTSNQGVYSIINAALILDAAEMLRLEEMYKENLWKTISRTNCQTVREVLTYSVKYMRLLNKCIVSKGTPFNTAQRMVFRGIPAEVLKQVRMNESFRMVTYACTSESTNTADGFTGNGDKEGKKSKLTITIPQGCYNAGQINRFGESVFPGENETLIPPYSYFTCTKKDKNGHIELTLAEDNLNHPIEGVTVDV